MIVVDDDRDSADMLAEILTADDREIFVAYDRATALRLLGAPQVDLLLLDLLMGGTDCLDVASAARARFGRAIRIIAITGFGNDELHDRARAAGCDQVLLKPVERAVLDDAVNA